MASGVLTVYVNHKKLNRNNPPAYSEHSGSKMDLVSSGSPMTSTARASRHFLSPYVTWPLSLQHLTLLTSLCLPRQYTPDFWSSPSPLPIISSACPQMPMLPIISSLTLHSLPKYLSSSPDLSNTNIQKIQKCISNPAFFSFLPSPISKGLWDRSSWMFHRHFKQCPNLKSSSSH